MVRNTPKKTYAALLHDPRLLGLDDPAYWTAMAPYRQACGLPPLAAQPKVADFSGHWVLDEEKSEFGRMGAAFSPAALDVVQHGNDLAIKTTRIVEFGDNEVAEEKLTLDGTEAKSEFMDSPRVTTARLADDGTLVLDSVVSLKWGPDGSKLTTNDVWTLQAGGDVLQIQRASHSFMGDQKEKLLFNRR
jgi:hypothetical protein